MEVPMKNEDNRRSNHDQGWGTYFKGEYTGTNATDFLKSEVNKIRFQNFKTRSNAITQQPDTSESAVEEDHSSGLRKN